MEAIIIMYIIIIVCMFYSFITLLIRLLVDAPTTVDSQHNFSDFAGRVLCDIVIPNTVWRGGRYVRRSVRMC